MRDDNELLSCCKEFAGKYAARGKWQEASSKQQVASSKWQVVEVVVATTYFAHKFCSKVVAVGGNVILLSLKTWT